MNAAQLRDLLARVPDDEEIVVYTEKSGLCHNVLAKVKSATRGFDWTCGKLLLFTEDGLVPVNEPSRPVREIARERLERLKAAHVKIHGSGAKYIPKTREEDWIDGFEAGAAMWFTGKE